MVCAGEEFLDTMTREARMSYAIQQLDLCRTAQQCWQERVGPAMSEFGHASVQYALDYYSRQIERWQSYLAGLSQ